MPAIGIVAATYWEMRTFIRRMPLTARDPFTYEGGADPGALLALSGVGQDPARQAAEKLAARRPACIVSTGFAGGLNPEIRAGDLVLDAGRSDPRLADLVEEIAAHNGIACHRGAFWSGRNPLLSAREKTETGLRTGAIAAEMEGQAVFQFCEERKIPFCSFRLVSDACGQTLPAAVQALDSRGKVGLSFWKALLARPWEWGAFLALARSSRRAEENLATVLTRFVLKAEGHHA